MEEHDKAITMAYFGGLFDACGSVSTQSRRRNGEVCHQSLRVSVYSGDRRILAHLRELTKAGSVLKRGERWEYRIESRRVREVLEMIRPYVISKREVVSRAMAAGALMSDNSRRG